ncbi:MAG: RNase adapter RapZ [Eubacteriales bacterium]|nr:RNase adapter RapZ [Eubacteriales bacterium]
MNFVIITGLSGSGKSLALKFLEDMGYFCVDNLPPMLLGNLADACMNSRDKLHNVAVVMDIRGGTFFDGIYEALDSLTAKGIKRHILFMDASPDVLIKRYKETRHTHPLEGGLSLTESILREKSMLLPLKEKADIVIDTSGLSGNGLREEIHRFLQGEDSPDRIYLRLCSFGFKRGVPTDADMVFDVRFLPNPYYVPELRTKNGKTPETRQYLLSYPETGEFVRKTAELLRFILPLYARETKNNLNVAIGCTGGMHRSVLIAELLGEQLAEAANVRIQHRDLAEEEQNALNKAEK